MLAKEIQPDFPKDSPLSVTVFHGSCQMPHYHRDVFEFILCLSGRLQVRNMHEKHTLLPGDILQADTYDIHTIDSKTAGEPAGPVAPTAGRLERTGRPERRASRSGRVLSYRSAPPDVCR